MCEPRQAASPTNELIRLFLRSVNPRSPTNELIRSISLCLCASLSLFSCVNPVGTSPTKELIRVFEFSGFPLNDGGVLLVHVSCFVQFDFLNPVFLRFRDFTFLFLRFFCLSSLVLSLVRSYMKIVFT